MAKKGKKSGKRKSTSNGSRKNWWMDKAGLAGTLLLSATALTMADRWREGKSLNPFAKEYYTT
jgi:hypothetical protein